MVHAIAGAAPESTATDIAVDHIGVVVRDLASGVAGWRALGFSVSDPVALMGTGPDGQPVPLGQASAHVVFENSYIELSSPVPGSGNHLEPYLAAGEGVRILVLATADADAARAAVAAGWPGTSDIRLASRAMHLAGSSQTARFRWFPLPADILPSTLSAAVQHLTPELVFHQSQISHPNGARRITAFHATGRVADLAQPPLPAGPDNGSPRLRLVAGDGALAIRGFGIADEAGGERFFAV